MMPFDVLTSLAIPLPEDNIDTDIILPARFLLHTEKTGLGRFAFAERRARPGFVIDDPRHAGAAILVAGANFGCGSSREQAAWALLDLGIRCVIAPGFGEIFAGNAISNGLLPLALPVPAWRHVLAEADAGWPLTVSLVTQSVALVDGETIGFDFDAGAREMMINGWDDISMIRARHAEAIAAFERQQRQDAPWLWDRAMHHG